MDLQQTFYRGRAQGDGTTYDRTEVRLDEGEIRSIEDEPPSTEKTALRLLKSRMEQKNGVQRTLIQNGIMFKIDEQQAGLPEIIKGGEDTFMELLMMADDDLPTSIDDEGYENDDLDDDGLIIG